MLLSFENEASRHTSYLGEPAGRIQAAPGRDARLVLVGKEVCGQFPPTAHTDFLEDRLEVVLHGVGRDVNHRRHLLSRLPP